MKPKGEIIYTRKNDLVRLVISNPAKKNAISYSMWLELADHIEKIKNDSQIRMLVIEGDQNHFSSGADISEFSELRAGHNKKEYDKAVINACKDLQTLLIPTIAYIKGYCFGGGFGLAMQCDFRFCEPDAIFSLPVVKRGLSYSKEQIRQLITIVGVTNAKDILFTGRKITAQEAELMGFTSIVNNPVKKDADNYVTMITENAPLSVQAVKAGFLELTGSGTGHISHEELTRLCSESADYREATLAFTEKRKPRFRGK